MKERHIYRTFYFLAVCFATPLAANAEPSLRFEVHGLAHGSGQLGINLFRNDDEMFEHPIRTVVAPIHDGSATISIHELPNGEYAAVAYHDENSNGELDHHFLGFPNEPLGYSGGFEFGLFSGMPSFDKLKFRFSAPQQNVVIHIQ